MISNERPSPYGYRPALSPRPPVQEDTLKYGQVEIERASFHFMLKSNPRGRFLRITEKSAGAFSCLIVPDTGLENFKQVLDKMRQAAGETPPAAPTASRVTLKTESVQVERKSFLFALELDARGQFLRIVEKSGSHCNDLIVPVSGLEVFTNLVDEMWQASDAQPQVNANGTDAPQWTPVVEESLKSGELKLERKTFSFHLKKNASGRFLRIIEEKETRSSAIIIPAEGLDEFKKWVMEMTKASKKIKD
jgi:hypothetical protein